MKQELNRLAQSQELFGSYFFSKEQHGGREYSTSDEERLQREIEGEALLSEMVKYFNPNKYVDLLEELDDQVNN